MNSNKLSLFGIVIRIVASVAVFWLVAIFYSAFVATLSGANTPDIGAFIHHRLSEHPLTLGIDVGDGGTVIVAAAMTFVIVILLFFRDTSLEPNAVDPNTVHGKARWATREEMQSFEHTSEVVFDYGNSQKPTKKKKVWKKPEICETLEDDNFIMSDFARISLSDNPVPSLRRNKHIFVEAGSGAGKSYNFIGSNIMQLNSSYVFTDPKGELFEKYAELLRRNGYRIVVVNIQDEEGFKNSNGYNPMHYVKNMTAVGDIVELIIENTSEKNVSGSAGSEFYNKAERQLYSAELGRQFHAYHKLAPEKMSLPAMVDSILMAGHPVGNDPNRTALDVLFVGTPEEMNGTHGHRSYMQRVIDKYRGNDSQARQSEEWAPINFYEGFLSVRKNPETLSNILASCNVRLAPFNIPSIRNMFSKDELGLERIGTEKTALFIVTSAQKGTYDWIASMILYQLFDQLTAVANTFPGKKLPLPVVCYLDEVANIGTIPGLAKNLAVLRSYGVSLVLITQSKDDLKRSYSDQDVESILNNCDVFLYLGRDGMETCKRLSEEIGMTTRAIITKSRSGDSKSSSRSESVQYIQVPLMPADEIANALDGNECLLHFKQTYWFRDFKADPTKHPRWKELQEAGLFNMSAVNDTNEKKITKDTLPPEMEGLLLVTNLSEMYDLVEVA